MQGSVVIDFGTGWACSNEASLIVDRQVIPDGKGGRLSKHTKVIRAIPYMTVLGSLEKETEAEIVFKEDFTEEKKGYKVKVTALTEQMLIMEVLHEIENYKLIIQKIKGGYNHGK